ncbi:MAG: acyl carrier protein [Clostridia bacterium]|nr:acyl carrier protein [Clostridia bacterium]
MLSKLLTIINEAVEGETLTEERLDEDLTALGMDSILFIQIIVRIEETFRCEIPDSRLLMDEMNTVNKILGVLKELGVHG